MAALALVAGLGLVRAAAPADPPRTRAQATAVAEPFPWSTARRLTWSDFLGRPDVSSAASAWTVYTVKVEDECQGDLFTFRAESFFQPMRSWVKPLILFQGEASRRILRHEQAHFDLSEVHVRKLRRAFHEVAHPCQKTPEERNAISAAYLRADADTQRQFDRETQFGFDDRQQSIWEERIRKDLASLRDYGGLPQAGGAEAPPYTQTPLDFGRAAGSSAQQMPKLIDDVRRELLELHGEPHARVGVDDVTLERDGNLVGELDRDDGIFTGRRRNEALDVHAAQTDVLDATGGQAAGRTPPRSLEGTGDARVLASLDVHVDRLPGLKTRPPSSGPMLCVRSRRP
jgi:hypothetical protein